MATKGSGLQAKVSRMLSKDFGKPILKPNKPLALRNEVANRKLRQGEASCLTEMSVMMACWKQSEFNHAACAQEVQAFQRCTALAQAERKARMGQESSGQGGRLHPKQANTLLKRHPNLYREI
ncbi:coiled-coil-helix-coiled-coil-helix domain-containing protein 1-like [Huso huso]|uniref:Coiled-coil-helix-coiled-coil-helix domain-containing protein 1-like n=2 Tax=Acipenseridae TaxID=7900 RepID=A0AAD8G783_ACIOX|nr:coiled-coil-helix-coiled-coil-helix domain-containing protein 1-like [Acipenser oxyrinchus oxyrinchus]